VGSSQSRYCYQQIKSTAYEICQTGSMSGVWKRGYGKATMAPSNERDGNRQAKPNATAPHLDFNETGFWLLGIASGCFGCSD
jgi:hypothetical protein